MGTLARSTRTLSSLATQVGPRCLPLTPSRHSPPRCLPFLRTPPPLNAHSHGLLLLFSLSPLEKLFKPTFDIASLSGGCVSPAASIFCRSIKFARRRESTSSTSLASTSCGCNICSSFKSPSECLSLELLCCDAPKLSLEVFLLSFSTVADDAI